jgi:hypothetical protein
MSIKHFWPWSDESLERKLTKATGELYDAADDLGICSWMAVIKDKGEMESLVNKYKRFKLPAHLILAMGYNSRSDKDIESINFTRKERRTLRRFERKISRKQSLDAPRYILLLNSIAKGDWNPKRDLEYATKINENRLSFLWELRSTDNPLEFLATATDEQMKLFETIPLGKREEAVDYIKQIPKCLFPLILEQTDPKPSVKYFMDKPFEKLEMLAQYNPDIEGLVPAMTTLTSDGILLSAGEDYLPNNLNKFLKVWKANKGNYFLMRPGMAPYINRFADKFDLLDHDQKILLMVDIGSMLVANKHYIVTLAAKFGFDSKEYNTGFHIRNIDVSNECKYGIVSNKQTASFVNELPDQNSRQLYATFIDWTSPEAMANMSRDEFQHATRAYHIAQSANELAPFKEGFLGVSKNGDLKSWAKAIIKHQEKDAIGGDSYHKRKNAEVIAA